MRFPGIFFAALPMMLAGTVLASAGQERHEIEVRGRKVPFRIDPRRDMIIIEGDVLRRLPAMQAAEIVALAANMNFVVRGLFQADPQMQGFNQEQISVLLDGVPVNNAQTGHHNFLLPVATDDIDRVEILRGGCSSSFGVSAGGGSVNIVTAAGRRLSFRRSSFRTTDVSVSVGKGSLRASAGFTGTSGYAEGLDGRRAFARAAGRIAGGVSFLDFGIGYVGARFGAAGFYGPTAAGETVSRLLGNLSGGTKISAGLTAMFRLSGQVSRDDFLLERDDPAKYRNIHDTFQGTADASLEGRVREIEVSLGFAATADGINSSGIRAGAPASALGRHRRRFHSLRISTGKESSAWSWRAGLDVGMGDYGGWGGSFILSRAFGTGFRLTAAAARTFRVPTYTELYYSDPLHVSDPSLEPERTDSVTLSAEGVVGRISWGGRLFVSRIRDLIDWFRSGPGEVWRSANINDGSFGGFDLRAELKSAAFLARLLYTYQKTRFAPGPGASLKYRYYFPDHVLSLIGSGKWGDWETAVTLRAEREERTGRVRPYLGARLGRKLDRIDAFVEIQNAFNERAEKIPGLPEAPRRFGLGVGFSF